MAALGTLVTIVTADASGFKAEMVSSADSAQMMERRVTQSLGGVRSKMAELKQSLHGFKDLMNLGLGVHLGGNVYSRLHEGFEKFGEGFRDGLEHAKSFEEALGEGAKHLLGMETSSERLARRMEESTAGAKKLGEMVEILDRLSGKNEGKPDYVLEAEREVAAAEKIAKERNEAARPGRDKIAALKLNLAEWESKPRTEGEMLRQVLFSGGSGFKTIKEQLADAQKEYGGKIHAADEGEERLKEIRREAEAFKEKRRLEEEQKRTAKEQLEAGRKTVEAEKEAKRKREEEGEREAEIMRERLHRADEIHRAEEQNRQDRLEEQLKQDREK
jgi:hypothetical protein